MTNVEPRTEIKPMSQVSGWKSEKVPEIRSRTHPDSTEEN